jgi:hypothetical protein
MLESLRSSDLTRTCVVAGFQRAPSLKAHLQLPIAVAIVHGGGVVAQAEASGKLVLDA